jgi:hypothetical protein
MPRPTYDLQLDPYALTHQLDGSQELFWVSKMMADTILSDQSSIIEGQTQHVGIPYDNAATTSAIRRAIPDAQFSDLSIVRHTGNGNLTQFYLRDQNRPGRIINITERPVTAAPATYSIHDTYDTLLHDFPLRRPRVAMSIGQSSVRGWLEKQFWGKGQAPDPGQSIEELCDLLGSKAKLYWRDIKLGATVLNSGAVLYAERDSIYDTFDPTGQPASSIYSAWLTGAFDVDAFYDIQDDFESATSVSVRNFVQFDGKNFADPQNAFTCDFTAEFAADPTKITRLALRPDEMDVHVEELQDQGVDRFMRAYRELTARSAAA